MEPLALPHGLVELVWGLRPPVVVEVLAVGTDVGELDDLHAETLGDALREVRAGVHDDVHVAPVVIGLAQARNLLRHLGIGNSICLGRLTGF